MHIGNTRTMQLTQVQALLDFVKDTLGEEFTPYQTEVAKVLTKEQKRNIIVSMYEGMMSGDISYNSELNSKKVRKYATGVVNNHFKKNRCLNGDVIYKPSSSSKTKEQDIVSKIDHSILPEDMVSILKPEQEVRHEDV